MRFFCRPFRGRPTPEQWHALIDHLAALHAQRPRHLVVIDSLAHFFAGGTESLAPVMLDVLTPLTRLAEAGLSVLLLHHPRRQGSARGQAARGSGALMGFVDVLIEMRSLAGAEAADRRRRLEAMSRFDETPHDRIIELSADGTDYASLGDLDDALFADDWRLVRKILSQAECPLTQAEVLERWPALDARPSELTLWRRLVTAFHRTLVIREGTGHRGQAYRYFLPGMPQEWELHRQAELAALHEPVRTLADITQDELQQRRQDQLMDLLRDNRRREEEMLRQLGGREE